MLLAPLVIRNKHNLMKNNPFLFFPGLPMAEILMLCGFFMIYIVEELTHALVDKCHNKSEGVIFLNYFFVLLNETFLFG